MKFFFSDHFLIQVKERRISKRLAKSIYLQATKRYFDTLTGYHVAIARRKHLGKMRNIMIAYDAIIVGEIWFVTSYPVRDKEIENRIRARRWVLKNEKN